MKSHPFFTKDFLVGFMNALPLVESGSLDYRRKKSRRSVYRKADFIARIRWNFYNVETPHGRVDTADVGQRVGREVQARHRRKHRSRTNYDVA